MFLSKFEAIIDASNICRCRSQ